MELPLQDLLFPRSAPIYGRARAGEPRLLEQGLPEGTLRNCITGLLICIAPPRTIFPTRMPKK